MPKNAHQISEYWYCGHIQQPSGSSTFWIACDGDDDCYTFHSGAGIPLEQINKLMCLQVAEYLDAQNAIVVFGSTFRQVYEAAMREVANDEMLWLEDAGGVMPIPYTSEQLEEAMEQGNPPASLEWLLTLDDPFSYMEEDEHLWFVFEHLMASYGEEEGWVMFVTYSDSSLGFETAQKLPYCSRFAHFF